MAIRGTIICRDPLVLISSTRPPLFLGVASVHPSFFATGTSLHLLSPSWSLLKNIGPIKEQLSSARTTMPKARFFFLANEEAEAIELQSHGIPTMLGNANMFIDEAAFQPVNDCPKRFSAIYNAALQPYKNHRLCKDIRDLALIYYVWNRNEVIAAYGSEIKTLLSQATLLNEADGEPYRRLSSAEIAIANSQSAVGLCLSAVEGQMRAAVEYLLCGTPVVSIPSLGGRQRYFNRSNSIIVEPDAGAVARAVRDLEDRNLPRDVIRKDILAVLNFERGNFLAALNYLLFKLFRIDCAAPDFESLRDVLKYRNSDEWLAYLSGR